MNKIIQVINIHGFMGEADNQNRKSLVELGFESTLFSPQIDYVALRPSEVVGLIEDYLKTLNPNAEVVFVGQSLGGWFANYLSLKHGKPCLLTNPCFDPENTTVVIDSPLLPERLNEYRQMKIDKPNPQAVALCTKTDEVLGDNYSKCEKNASSVIEVKGQHSFIENRTEKMKQALVLMGIL